MPQDEQKPDDCCLWGCTFGDQIKKAWCAVPCLVAVVPAQRFGEDGGVSGVKPGETFAELEDLGTQRIKGNGDQIGVQRFRLTVYGCNKHQFNYKMFGPLCGLVKGQTDEGRVDGLRIVGMRRLPGDGGSYRFQLSLELNFSRDSECCHARGV